MKKDLRWIFFALILSGAFQLAQAQEDEFDFGDFEAAGGTEIKNFCTNKVINLSPTKLVSVSYDFVGAFDLESENAAGMAAGGGRIGLNHGLRLDANFPIVSKNNILINSTIRYWESHYNLRNPDEGNSFARLLDDVALRTTTVGLVVFKPLNDRHFFIVQAEAAVNGNYNVVNIAPDFGEMKYSAAALFGWKTNDFTMVAVGATRTYRGGRVLHIPILLYNKTFNERWGTEMLLPAFGALRYNFSTKSLLKFGYELEGQSYFLQTTDNFPDPFAAFAGPGAQSVELRKSEIRPRITWDVAMSDFVWLSFQAGMRVNYRFDLDATASSSEAILNNRIGLPFYFGFGINLASP